MKQTLKLISLFLTGTIAGLLIAAIGVVLFTDTTLREFV